MDDNSVLEKVKKEKDNWWLTGEAHNKEFLCFQDLLTKVYIMWTVARSDTNILWDFATNYEGAT